MPTIPEYSPPWKCGFEKSHPNAFPTHFPLHTHLITTWYPLYTPFTLTCIFYSHQKANFGKCLKPNEPIKAMYSGKHFQEHKGGALNTGLLKPTTRSKGKSWRSTIEKIMSRIKEKVNGWNSSRARFTNVKRHISKRMDSPLRMLRETGVVSTAS